jgi:FkbM family methyltransferase
MDRRVILPGELVALDLLGERWPAIADGRPTVFDVGANEGAYAVEVLERVPHAELFCFEPQGTCRVPSAGNVTVETLALSDRCERLELWRDQRGSYHASAHRRQHPHLAEFHPFDVEAITIDAYCSLTGVTRIDWLKLDVEGHELAILHGARLMLALGRISVIQFEFNENAGLAGSTFLAFWTLLRANHDFFFFMEGHEALEPIPVYDRADEAPTPNRNYLAVHASAEWMRA